MGCRIFLIRHGETIWNKQLKFQGHEDVPLSTGGLEQASALASRLEGQTLDGVYASDLSRAMETARGLAAPRGLEVFTDPSLREMNFGQWEGLTFKQIQEKYQEQVKLWWSNPVDTRVPGGETLSELAARVTAFVSGLVEKHAGGQVAVVCHGGPVRVLVAKVLGMDLNQYWRIRQDNASLNVIDFASWDKGIVVLLNDRSHLGKEIVPPYVRI